MFGLLLSITNDALCVCACVCVSELKPSVTDRMRKRPMKEDIDMRRICVRILCTRASCSHMQCSRVGMGCRMEYRLSLFVSISVSVSGRLSLYHFSPPFSILLQQQTDAIHRIASLPRALGGYAYGMVFQLESQKEGPRRPC